MKFSLRLDFVGFTLLAVLALFSGQAAAQIPANNVDNVTAGRQLLDSNNLWGAKDHLERAQVQAPQSAEIKELLGKTYSKLAVVLLQQKKPTEALVFVDKALALAPNQVELEYVRARSYEDLKDVSNAITSFEATLTAQAKYKDSEQRLIYLYKLRGQEFLQKADLRNAQADFMSLRKYAAEDTDANYYLGYIALQTKDFDNARKFLLVSEKDERLQRLSQMYLGMVEAETRHWLDTVKWMVSARQDETLRPQTDPYLTAAHYNLGVVAFETKKYDDADSRFQEVLRLEPQHKDAIFNLAMTWEAKGDLDAARGYYVRVRSMEPGYRRVEVGLANVDYLIGRRLYENSSYEKAQAMFKESAQLDTSRGEPHYFMGLVYRRWNEDTKAAPEFDYAISRAAFVIESRFEAGEISFAQQDWPRTIKYLEAVEQKDAKFNTDKVKGYLRECWWKLAMADIQGRQWVQAETNLKKVLKYPPDLPQTHFYLGLAALRQLHYDTAVAELEPTYKKQPNDIETRKYLAEAHYKLGVAAYAAQRYPDAHVELARAAEVEPSNNDTQYQLARTRIELNRFPEAIGVLERLAKMEPPFRDSPDDLAKAYGGYGEQLLDKNNKPQARIYFDKALNLNPAELRALYGSGAIALSEKRFDDAARALDQVNDRNPDYRRNYPMLIEANWNIGLRAYDKKDPVTARKYFEKVIDLDPNNGEALYYLGDLEVNAKSLDAAKNYFERAINRKTKLTEAHYGLGTVLYDQQKYGEAIEHFEFTAKNNPTYKNVDSYWRRAIYNEADRLFRAGQKTEAATYYERYFKLEPTDSKIALKIADIAEKEGLMAQAIEWYERAIPLMKSDTDPIRFKVAMLYFTSKDYDKALQTANRIKSADAKDLKGTIYLSMGKRDREAGKLRDAMVNLKTALQYFPDNATALFEYGQLRYAMDDLGEAATSLRKAVDKDPSLPNGKKLVAEVFRKIGKEMFTKERLADSEQAYKTSSQYEASIEVDYYVGVIAFLKKDLQTALVQFRKVDEKDGKYEANTNYLKDTVCKLGADAIAKEDMEKAKMHVSECSRLNPSDRTLRYQLALLAFKRKEYFESRQRFRDIVLNSRADSQFPEAEGYLLDSLFALEDQSFKTEDYEKAEKYADEVLERSSNSYRGLYLKGRNLEQMQKWADAENYLRKALSARPGFTEAVDALKRVQAQRQSAPALVKPSPGN